jgi:tetratricopeptide (TPR) repeat protein
MDLMQGYHMRAHIALGPRHPNVITSCFKLSLDQSRKGNFDAAVEIGTSFLSIHSLHLFFFPINTRVGLTVLLSQLGLEGLVRAESTFGAYSANYIVGLISIGEIHMRRNNIEEAINYFSKALLFTERIHGHHPLIGKLSTYLGRLQLMTDNKRAGIKAMSRGYKVYEVTTPFPLLPISCIVNQHWDVLLLT